MTNFVRTPAPEVLKSFSLERLLHLWDFTTNASYVPVLPMVRGWIMDELEARNPYGFNAWLDQDAPRDEDLRTFIYRFPALTKENARVGQYYAFADGYQIVKRLYRISEKEAEENGLMYLDRVETTVGDFALPGSDVYHYSVKSICNHCKNFVPGGDCWGSACGGIPADKCYTGCVRYERRAK